VTCDVLARIEVALLNQLIGVTERAWNAGCSQDRAVNILIFPIRYFNMPYWVTVPSDSMEFRAADSEVDLERHANIQRI
jgi:hypothetical protein